jgi:hypothetical protein
MTRGKGAKRFFLRSHKKKIYTALEQSSILAVCVETIWKLSYFM